jgi:hypothetical protein
VSNPALTSDSRSKTSSSPVASHNASVATARRPPPVVGHDDGRRLDAGAWR